MNLADNINIDGGADSWEPMVTNTMRDARAEVMAAAKLFHGPSTRPKNCAGRHVLISATRKILEGSNFSATAPHIKLLCGQICVVCTSTQSIISGRSVAILCDGKFFVIR